ncbi:MAG: hypothetical protein J7L45_03375 [Candidatus Aenigmarchaeota archaeon]|nr:hypothetical protein [Candidatus Aenigmarchaeota archaeon]
MVSPAQLCLYCKGSRNLCGLGYCPLLKGIEKAKVFDKDEFFGPSSSVFIGRVGYPNVFVGPLGWAHDDDITSPKNWFGMEYEKIIEMRSFVLRSKYKVNIRSKDRFVEENQLIAMSKKPVDVELKFKGKPVRRMNFSTIVQPMGPSAVLKEMKTVENVSVKRAVERIVNDDIKSNEAINLLYQKRIDLYKITEIFSSGIVGKDKKMVPTRWSITAVDDIITKNLLNEIRKFKPIDEFRVYEMEFLNNHFEILLIPGFWEFENFEAWAPGSFWSQNLKKTQIIEEYEPFEGRKKYAEKEAGGYYAARFGIVEALYKMRRQARVVSFREVYEGYMVPLGVWVVRETVRNAMKRNYESFSTLKDALDHIRSKLRIPLEKYIEKSKILQQRRLSDFLRSI